MPNEQLRCDIFSRGNRIKMPSSNAIIGPIALKCSVPMCLSRWSRYGRSPPNGCCSITKSGPMSRWRACRPPSIGPNLKTEILLCHSLLDGGAYATPPRPINMISANRMTFPSKRYLHSLMRRQLSYGRGKLVKDRIAVGPPPVPS